MTFQVVFKIIRCKTFAESYVQIWTVLVFKLGEARRLEKIINLYLRWLKPVSTLSRHLVIRRIDTTTLYHSTAMLWYHMKHPTGYCWKRFGRFRAVASYHGNRKTLQNTPYFNFGCSYQNKSFWKVKKKILRIRFIATLIYWKFKVNSESIL